jgi:uncharacterized protein YjbI with pentapeptide repeats
MAPQAGWQREFIIAERLQIEQLLQRLKYGSAPWNAWRREIPDAPIVLDGVDLSGMILTGVDFSDARLRGARLHATNLMNADLRRADFTNADRTEADLIAVKLQGTILTGAILTGATLKEADLLGADLIGTIYAPADLTGALQRRTCEHGTVEPGTRNCER